MTKPKLLACALLGMLVLCASCSWQRPYRQLSPDNVFSTYQPDTAIKIDNAYKYAGKVERDVVLRDEKGGVDNNEFLEGYLFTKGQDQDCSAFLVLQIYSGNSKMSQEQKYSLITSNMLRLQPMNISDGVIMLDSQDLNPVLLNMGGHRQIADGECYLGGMVLERSGRWGSPVLEGYWFTRVRAENGACPKMDATMAGQFKAQAAEDVDGRVLRVLW